MLVEPTALAVRPDFLARQRVTARFPGGEASFEAALQKQGETLTVIGLTPFGTRAFTLLQAPSGVTFTSQLPEGKGPPLEPRYLLQDIHHAYFLALPPAPGAGGADATEVAPLGPELVTEARGPDGTVLARTFRRRDPPPAGEVTVTYEDGAAGTLPKQVRIENGYYGYELTIETLSVQLLE